VRNRTSTRGHGLLPATLALIALALGAATFGVETNRDALALLGLGTTGLLAAALAAHANRSLRLRDELRAANTELRRKTAQLETRQLSIESALMLIDDRTQGALGELVEAAGEGLAEIVDDVLDESTGSRP
jgi:hypothetical protein